MRVPSVTHTPMTRIPSGTRPVPANAVIILSCKQVCENKMPTLSPPLGQFVLLTTRRRHGAAPIVRHRHDGALKRSQCALEPRNAAGVQVVGGLLPPCHTSGHLCDHGLVMQAVLWDPAVMPDFSQPCKHALTKSAREGQLFSQNPPTVLPRVAKVEQPGSLDRYLQSLFNELHPAARLIVRRM